MPRALPPATKARGGRRTVTYRDSRGRTHDAVVTGRTGTTLNLRVGDLPAAQRLKTNVARSTTLTDTNVWL